MHEIQDPYNLLKPKKLELNDDTYRMIAHLVNPLTPFSKEYFYSFKWCPDTILWTLKNNRLLYRLLSLENTSDLERKCVINELKNTFNELRLSEIFYTTYKNKVLQLVEKLNQNAINVIFFKATNDLPMDSHNLDVLIKEEDKNLVESILQKTGFTKVSFYKEPYKILYRYTKNAEDYIALHLHTKISWHGVEVVDKDRIWEKKRKKMVEGTNVYFPDEGSHILITIAHMFFEKAEISLSDVLDVISDLQRSDVDVKTLFSLARNAGWEDVFSTYLYAILKLYKNLYGTELLNKILLNAKLYDTISPNIPPSIQHMLLKYETKYLPINLDPELKWYRRQKIIKLGLFSKTLSNSRTIFMTNMIQALFRQLYNRGKECRTFIVALEGTDGSGKTSHAQKLMEEFNKRGKKTLYIWSTGSLPFVNLIRPLVSKLTSPGTQSKFLPSITSKSNFLFFEKMLQNKIFNSLLIMAIIMDHAFNLTLKILSAKNTCDVIVLDRFIHDTIINNIYCYKKNLSSPFSRVLLCGWPLLLCKPDITLILYSTPKELKRRRENELTLTEAFDKVVTYRRYSQLWRASLVNSTKDFTETHLEVLETVLKRFYGKQK